MVANNNYKTDDLLSGSSMTPLLLLPSNNNNAMATQAMLSGGTFIDLFNSFYPQLNAIVSLSSYQFHINDKSSCAELMKKYNEICVE